jgi:protein SCO1/2
MYRFWHLSSLWAGCASAGRLPAALALLTAAAAAIASESPAIAPTAPSAPTPASTQQTNYFLVKGEVREVRSNRRSAIIRHEEIPDYMVAMTMPFDVKDPAELKGIKPGDIVSFRLIVTEEEGWIDMVHKLGTTNSPPPPPRETFRQVRQVDPLNVGDFLPDYPFTNELGKVVRLKQFEGQALALTFIFTRCPYPNYCPRMSSNFSEAARRMKALTQAPTNYHFLSVSFDPEFDTPAVLRTYAQAHGYDSKRWNFLTGALVDIDAITEQFGLDFPRAGINFAHNFRTVVVDASGRIRRIIIGHEWKVDELVTELIQAARSR